MMSSRTSRIAAASLQQRLALTIARSSTVRRWKSDAASSAKPAKQDSFPGLFNWSIGKGVRPLSLFENYPGVPEATPLSATPRTANLTTLPSGVRVASISSQEPAVAVGVYVAAGTRSESRHSAGSTHFLKQLAFHSTENRQAVQLVREFEGIGATLTSSATREHLLFASEAPADKAQGALTLLLDVLRPRLPYHEIERQRPKVDLEAEELENDPVTSILEATHAEAFRNHGLGQPLVAPRYNLHHITHESLRKHVSSHYTPQHIVVVGVGADHEKLVEGAQQLFASSSSAAAQAKPAASKYVGGEIRVAKDGNSHVTLAFEGVASKNVSDVLALGILEHILGGGTSSNLDRPGTGSSSRLYRNIAASNPSVQAISAFNISYSDAGLFGIYAETTESPSKLLHSIKSELQQLTSSIKDEDITRARAAFKSSIFFRGEKRGSALEFIGEQVLAGLKPQTPEQYAAHIDKITKEDVIRAAKRVFSSKPTVAVIGDVSSVPTAAELQIAKQD